MAATFGMGYRCSTEPVLLWLWRRPAAAAPIGPLAWELPYIAGAVIKKKKKITSVLLELFSFYGTS